MQGGDPNCLGGGRNPRFESCERGDRPISSPLDTPLAKGNEDIASLEICNGVAVQVSNGVSLFTFSWKQHIFAQGIIHFTYICGLSEY